MVYLVAKRKLVVQTMTTVLYSLIVNLHWHTLAGTNFVLYRPHIFNI